MKTTPMAHQEVGRQRLRENLDSFLLACEQGTGKTWMALDDAEYQVEKNRAEAMLVIAPKGVHTNWVLREIPTHLSIPVRAAFYSSGASRFRKNEIEKLFRPRKEGELIVLSMNIDAINFKEGYALAARFLQHYNCIMIIDESSRIKGNTSARTKKAIKLGKLAVSRRAMSGTPITNSPADIFTQFEFLAPGQGLLGTTSYRTFVAEYTELMPQNSYIMNRIRDKKNAEARARGHAAAHESTYQAQIPKRDSKGFPIYKNLDKLNKILLPKMYRVLKKDCLDLPPKIYKTREYELHPAQRRLYDHVREELRLEFGEDIDIYSPLTLQTKLQQIASGFIMRDDVVNTISEVANGIEDETNLDLMDPDENPRMEVMADWVQDTENQFIIWARYRQEILQLSDQLRKIGVEFVEYHGGITKQADRDRAIDLFQGGKVQCFLGNAQSGGIGLTLTKAEDVLYYSQSNNAEIRWQSEDRNHRIGTTSSPTYTDVCGIMTVDEKISENLQRKERMASSALN